MASWNSQAYYYTDSCFQLELNLQAIRLALIYMLEESEASECFVCNRLRCRCEDSSVYSSLHSLSASDGFSFSEVSSASSLASELDYVFISAPPAEALPMPVWRVAKSHRSSPDLEEYYRDIEKWMQASTPSSDGSCKFQIDESINSEINCSWPPAPTSIWCESPPHVETPRAQSPCEDRVGAFFRSFAEAQRGYSYF